MARSSGPVLLIQSGQIEFRYGRRSIRDNLDFVFLQRVTGADRFRQRYRAAPKVYGFDTGFMAYYRGWDSIRPDDRGCFWEHYVLTHLSAHGFRQPVALLVVIGADIERAYQRKVKGATIRFSDLQGLVDATRR